MMVVQIHPAVLADLSVHILRGMRERPRQERMGILVGLRSVRIFEIQGCFPYRGVQYGRDYVEYDERRLHQRIRQIEQRTGRTFFGLYHSHPLRYRERIPDDLIDLAEASLVDRASFLHADPTLRPGYQLDAIIAAGPAHQAPRVTRFPVKICLPDYLRHRGHTWSFHLTPSEELALWMPGKVRVDYQPGCCSFSRQFSWFFAMRIYARGELVSASCKLILRTSIPYTGPWYRPVNRERDRQATHPISKRRHPT